MSMLPCDQEGGRRHRCPDLQRAAVDHRQRTAQNLNTAEAMPATVSEPPLIVSPPVSQLHKVRLPPMVPMLPPLLAPVSVSAAPLSSSSEPTPANEPENVVLVFPAIERRAEVSAGPMTTVPPPGASRSR